MQFPVLILLSTCLARVIADGGGGNLTRNQNNGIDREGNQFVGHDDGHDGTSTNNNKDQQRDQEFNNAENNNNTVTVTVTTTATRQAAAALTVMTITVTQTQPCKSVDVAAALQSSVSPLSSAPNAVSTTVLTVPTDSASTARQFVTNGNVQFGLTSIPVAEASALGRDSDTAMSSSEQSTSSMTSSLASATVSPGNFATEAASQSGLSATSAAATPATTFAGTTFITTASLVPGISSIPVADSKKSAT